MWRHGFRSLSDVDTVRGVEHVAVDNSLDGLCRGVVVEHGQFRAYFL